MKIVTYQTTRNERMDICHACEAKLTAMHWWPKSTATGEEYCTVYHGAHDGDHCDVCGADERRESENDILFCEE